MRLQVPHLTELPTTAPYCKAVGGGGLKVQKIMMQSAPGAQGTESCLLDLSQHAPRVVCPPLRRGQERGFHGKEREGRSFSVLVELHLDHIKSVFYTNKNNKQMSCRDQVWLLLATPSCLRLL